MNPGASVGHITTGAIDGKFDNGYFITVVVGSEKLHGILYHVPTENASPQFATIPGLIRSVGSELDALGLQVQVNKKKKETPSKKDPNAPRPAKKSYNFFYAEQCARLKKKIIHRHIVNLQEWLPICGTIFQTMKNCHTLSKVGVKGRGTRGRWRTTK